MSALSSNNTVHVEVRLKRSEQRLKAIQTEIEPQISSYLTTSKCLYWNVAFVPNVQIVSVETLLLEKHNGEKGPMQLDPKKDNLIFHFYMTQRSEMRPDTGLFDGGGDDDCLDSVIAANHLLLPANELTSLWENLIYEEGLKERLLKFALSALSFSQHNVDTNVIACNRLLLLHGPPGTGKTSLCKALAQKLAIRTQNCFAYTHLVEINSHSLFSKWFSESGKMVARLFGKIGELVSDQNNLVCVLIDEVESLAYARSAMSSNEPRDAMRVVNAVLTQLDEIKSRPNVLILSTSNLAQSIDLAFLDRADIRQFIALPAKSAIACIYNSMFVELMTKGVIRKENLEDYHNQLQNLAERSDGLSGRTLRKLPLLAYAQYTNRYALELNQEVRLSDFIHAMLEALQHNLVEQQHLNQDS